jgi:hypothetical protein
MASMKWRSVTRPGATLPASKAIQGLPSINYRMPLLVTVAATVFVLLVTGFLTLVSLGNAITQWNKPDDEGGGSPAGILFCGSFSIVGTIISIYFVIAIIKGVRDLLSPVQYTRGTVADKREIGGRIVGDWIGVSPSYVGPDLSRASRVSEEQASASVDRSQIVNTRGSGDEAAALRPTPKRGGYLSPERISSTVTVDSESTGEPGMRAIFRVDPAAYHALTADAEVLVAHSRYLEHIYYVAHLRDGEWESFKNRALI